MLKEQRHNIEQQVLKVMAVFITMCYIMEPAHDELRHVFHFISHNLQAPSYVLQHDADLNYQDVVISQNSLTNHSHEILDFIDKIIDSSSEKNPHQGKFKSELSSIKKIVVYYDYKLSYHDPTNYYKLDNFKTENGHQTKGHSLQLYRPPQVLSHI